MSKMSLLDLYKNAYIKNGKEIKYDEKEKTGSYEFRVRSSEVNDNPEHRTLNAEPMALYNFG